MNTIEKPTALKSALLAPSTGVEPGLPVQHANKVNSNAQTLSTSIEGLLPNDAPGIGKNLVDWFYRTQIMHVPKTTLDVVVTEATSTSLEKTVVKTNDGYHVSFEGKNQEWKITAPDGTSTRIWGDPHVEESDGTKWDFHTQSTFLFGNNKITVEVAPWKNTSATVSKTVTIYNGDNRFTVTGLDNDKPKIIAWDFASTSHDRTLSDGVVFELVKQGAKDFSWQKKL